jgi:hypothetical protein
MANETRPSYFGQTSSRKSKSDYPTFPPSAYEFYNPFKWEKGTTPTYFGKRTYPAPIITEKQQTPKPTNILKPPVITDIDDFSNVDNRHYDTTTPVNTTATGTKTKDKNQRKKNQGISSISSDKLSKAELSALSSLEDSTANSNAKSTVVQSPGYDYNINGNKINQFTIDKNGTVTDNIGKGLSSTENSYSGFDANGHLKTSSDPSQFAPGTIFSATVDGTTYSGLSGGNIKDDLGGNLSKMLSLYEPIPKPFSGYGDAWNKGEGTLGGLSNMWDQFTAEGGSRMNPTASALEKAFGGLGNAASIYSGLMDAKYKKDLSNLANKQQAFQEAQANRVNQLQGNFQENYNKSFGGM